MKKGSIYLLLALPLLLGSCLNKFLETESDIAAKAESNAILTYAQNNKLNSSTTTGMYYNITRTNPKGDLPEAKYDAFVAFTIKTLDGINIISKTSRDSVILNLFTSNLFPGFKNAMSLLREGEKGTFVIPSAYAYGTNPPTGVPKNATILLDLEILDLISENDKIDAYIKKKGLKIDETTSTGLRFIRLNPVTTNPALVNGDNLVLKYNGLFLSEKSFDSGTTGYVFGGTNFIPGFLEGIKKLKKGEKARVIFPSTLGYGANGQGSIPPYTPLIFDIEISTVNGN